jgi:hypothetical protein
MADVLYLAGTVLFFGAMLGYVRACEALGKGTAEADKERAP